MDAFGIVFPSVQVVEIQLLGRPGSSLETTATAHNPRAMDLVGLELFGSGGAWKNYRVDSFPILFNHRSFQKPDLFRLGF